MTYENSNEYSSKGVGNAGLALGIVGTTLASGILNGNGVGGLFGGNNNQTTAMMAEIAQMKAEKAASDAALEQRDRLLQNWLKPLADEAAANKVVIAEIKGQVEKNHEICNLRMELADQKAATAQAVTNGTISALQMQVNSMQTCLSNITQCKVPNTAVCPGWGNVTITPATAG